MQDKSIKFNSNNLMDKKNVGKLFAIVLAILFLYLVVSFSPRSNEAKAFIFNSNSKSAKDSNFFGDVLAQAKSNFETKSQSSVASSSVERVKEFLYKKKKKKISKNQLKKLIVKLIVI
jgi:hypothetical protein